MLKEYIILACIVLSVYHPVRAKTDLLDFVLTNRTSFSKCVLSIAIKYCTTGSTLFIVMGDNGINSNQFKISLLMQEMRYSIVVATAGLRHLTTNVIRNNKFFRLELKRQLTSLLLCSFSVEYKENR